MTAPALHGLWIVDKPSGPTSHDIVAQARRYLGTRRVGHAGTLDPMATGVLVLLLGEATKLSEIATQADKTYLAEVSFGRATDSYDAEGRTTAERAVPEGWPDPNALDRALDAERRRTLQLPPTVSAIKVGGQRAYRLARSGAAPALAPRPVEVRELFVRAQRAAQLEVELRVSKGYFVRAFARDLGEALGMPAHLSALRRLRSGGFEVSDACSWPPPAAAAVIPLNEALPRLLPTLRLTPRGVERARQGKVLTQEDFRSEEALPDGLTPEPDLSGQLLAWTDERGSPVALGRRCPEGYRVQRGFDPTI